MRESNQYSDPFWQQSKFRRPGKLSHGPHSEPAVDARNQAVIRVIVFSAHLSGVLAYLFKLVWDVCMDEQ